MDLWDVSYDDLGKRIRGRAAAQIVNRCDAAAGEYLAQPGVSLETPRESVARAFLLDEVFRDLLDEAETDTLTVNSCMSTIVPISETTACLPLGLLNDDGYLAFCDWMVAYGSHLREVGYAVAKAGLGWLPVT